MQTTRCGCLGCGTQKIRVGLLFGWATSSNTFYFSLFSLIIEPSSTRRSTQKNLHVYRYSHSALSSFVPEVEEIMLCSIEWGNRREPGWKDRDLNKPVTRGAGGTFASSHKDPDKQKEKRGGEGGGCHSNSSGPPLFLSFSLSFFLRPKATRSCSARTLSWTTV